MSRGIVMSMRSHVLSFFFISKMSSLLALMVLSVWMGIFHACYYYYYYYYYQAVKTLINPNLLLITKLTKKLVYN